MQHKPEADEATDEGSNQGHSGDGIASPTGQGFRDGIQHTEAESDQVARVARHIDEKLAHGDGINPFVMATLPVLDPAWTCWSFISSATPRSA